MAFSAYLRCMGWDGQLAGEMVKGTGVFVLKSCWVAGRTVADCSCYMRCLATILVILCYSRVV